MLAEDRREQLAQRLDERAAFVGEVAAALLAARDPRPAQRLIRDYQEAAERLRTNTDGPAGPPAQGQLARMMADPYLVSLVTGLVRQQRATKGETDGH